MSTVYCKSWWLGFGMDRYQFFSLITQYYAGLPPHPIFSKKNFPLFLFYALPHHHPGVSCAVGWVGVWVGVRARVRERERERAL